MDFTEYKCPVCNEQFQKDEDIVVCPECGTPQHRACYESLGHCFYQDKHKEGFSFEENNSNASADDDKDNTTVICPRCKAVNPKELFYCQNCGLPLDKNSSNNNYNNNTNTQQQSGSFNQTNGVPPFGVGYNFDPMAGIDSNEPIAENVTAGEISKYVGKNTPYFLMIFQRIKKYNLSRYNFAAFLFSGIYFLYRKMYGLGILLSSLMLSMYVATYYIYLTPAYQSIRQTILQNSTQSFSSMFALDISMLSIEQLLLYNLPNIFSILILIIRIVCGAVANRSYYKHCVKQIKTIKSTDNTKPINEVLEQKGGVNIAIAICIGVVFLAINYIPLFINI